MGEDGSIKVYCRVKPTPHRTNCKSPPNILCSLPFDQIRYCWRIGQYHFLQYFEGSRRWIRQQPKRELWFQVWWSKRGYFSKNVRFWAPFLVLRFRFLTRRQSRMKYLKKSERKQSLSLRAWNWWIRITAEFDRYSAVSGFNATIFAYGQTGSGKTFSITGLLGKNEFLKVLK